MALLFIDSFEHYLSNADLLSKGWSSIHGEVFTGTGRRGGSALDLANVSIGRVTTRTFTDSSTAVVGYAIRQALYPSVDISWMKFRDSAAADLAEVKTTSTGALKLISGGVTLTTAAAIYAPNTYNYYELKYTKGTGANGFAELRQDGVVLLTITTSTETTDAGDIGVVESSNSVGVQQVDDLYLLNGTGSVNNNYLGDVRVDYHIADTDGSSTDFTPSSGSVNFEMVDDNPPDRDTTYVESGTVSARDINSVTAASLATAIHGVQQVALARKTDAGTVTVDMISQKPSGAGEKVQSSGTLPIDYAFSLGIAEVDPDDSTAWTDARVNATEFGFKIKSIVT